jgi:hypothetical protein
LRLRVVIFLTALRIASSASEPGAACAIAPQSLLSATTYSETLAKKPMLSEYEEDLVGLCKKVVPFFFLGTRWRWRWWWW